MDGGCETTEDRGRKTEDGGQKTEDGGRIEDKHEIRISKYETNSNADTHASDRRDRNTKFKRDSAYPMLDARKMVNGYQDNRISGCRLSEQ